MSRKLGDSQEMFDEVVKDALRTTENRERERKIANKLGDKYSKIAKQSYSEYLREHPEAAVTKPDNKQS